MRIYHTQLCRSRRLALAAAILGMVLFGANGSTHASVQCNQAARLLDGVASTAHKLHAATAAHRASRASALASAGLEKLSTAEFTELLAGPQGADARIGHAAFVAMFKRFDSHVKERDWQAASQLLATDMVPALPILVEAVSHSLDCDLQGLNSQIRPLTGAKIAANSPPAGQSSGRELNSESSGGEVRMGLGRFVGSTGYYGIGLISLVLCSAAGLVLQDRRERRKGPRHSIHFDTSIEFSGLRHRVRVLNIGSGGAKFTPNPGLADNDDIVILIDGRNIAANVRWHCETFAGVAFAEPLSEQQIGKLKA